MGWNKDGVDIFWTIRLHQLPYCQIKAKNGMLQSGGCAGRVMPYIFDPLQDKLADLAQGLGRAALSAGVRAPILVEKASLGINADADCKISCQGCPGSGV
jgi:hypothetical protein